MKIAAAKALIELADRTGEHVESWIRELASATVPFPTRDERAAEMMREINENPEEAASLRRSMEQTQRGEIRWLDEHQRVSDVVAAPAPDRTGWETAQKAAEVLRLNYGRRSDFPWPIIDELLRQAAAYEALTYPDIPAEETP